MNAVSNPKTAFLPDHLLEQVGHDEEMRLAIIDAFVDNFPGLLEKISSSLAQNDREGLKHHLHQIKSSLSLFGGDIPFQKAHYLEKNLATLEDTVLYTLAQETLTISRHILQEVINFRQLHKKPI
ncbi:MAG TPA: Hpt domain-containing protein [Cyclobacteriaceae bacterium]|nr:Hpt domain-containing protein [Cyclobacteriaceae bacterium]